MQTPHASHVDLMGEVAVNGKQLYFSVDSVISVANRFFLEKHV